MFLDLYPKGRWVETYISRNGCDAFIHMNVIWMRSFPDPSAPFVFPPSLKDNVSVSVEEDTGEIIQRVVPHSIFAIPRLYRAKIVS